MQYLIAKCQKNKKQFMYPEYWENIKLFDTVQCRIYIVYLDSLWVMEKKKKKKKKIMQASFHWFL